MAQAIAETTSYPWLSWLPVWQRNFRVWSKMWLPSLLANFGEPCLYLLGLGYGLGRFIGTMQDIPYLTFLASGIVCSSAMMTASFEGMYSAYSRMAVQKTWEAMLATPLNVRDVVLGEAVWAASKSLFSASAILVVSALLGAVEARYAVFVLPIVLLTGLCFAGLALIVTAISKSYDFFLYFTTLAITPMLLFCGVFFPLDQMPNAIQWLAWFLPLTHAVNLVRPLLTGLPFQMPWLDLVILMAYTFISLKFAIYLCQRRLSH